MTIGSFARPNSDCAVRNFAEVTQQSATETVRREPHLSFHAKAINHPNGSAVISLGRTAVVAGIDLVEIRVFVVELDQANAPALLEFHVEAASSHPRGCPAPMSKRIETALAFQIVTGIGRADQHLAEGSDLVAVTKRIDAGSEQQGIDLRVSVHAVDVVGPGKIGTDAQPAENAI